MKRFNTYQSGIEKYTSWHLADSEADIFNSIPEYHIHSYFGLTAS